MKKKNARQNSKIPRYMGCRTQEYTPESMSLDWLDALPKIAWCDFAKR
ncbi:MAG: hypothetical protein PVF96_05465 [Candidatus Bathyarchaeota archaeon]